jgi:hypothetical protein
MKQLVIINIIAPLLKYEERTDNIIYWFTFGACLNVSTLPVLSK